MTIRPMQKRKQSLKGSNLLTGRGNRLQMTDKELLEMRTMLEPYLSNPYIKKIFDALIPK